MCPTTSHILILLGYGTLVALVFQNLPSLAPGLADVANTNAGPIDGLVLLLTVRHMGAIWAHFDIVTVMNDYTSMSGT